MCNQGASMAGSGEVFPLGLADCILCVSSHGREKVRESQKREHPNYSQMSLLISVLISN